MRATRSRPSLADLVASSKPQLSGLAVQLEPRVARRAQRRHEAILTADGG